MSSTISLTLAIVLNIVAQILLKLGSTVLTKLDPSETTVRKILTIITNPLFLLAGILYGLAFLFYYITLSSSELSKVYPLISVSVIIAILIISVLFLGESFNLFKLAGVILCSLGIVLIFH